MSTEDTHCHRIYGDAWIALPHKIRSVLPKGKADTESLSHWAQLSPCEQQCAVPFLLIWLQDINWPVAPEVRSRLQPLGAALVPFLEPILESSDEIWQYWIISALLPTLPPDALQALRPHIKRLTTAPSAQEVDQVAAELLAALPPSP